MGRMIADGELVVDEFSNTRRGPDFTAKAEGRRPLREQRQELVALIRREARRRPRRRVVTQCLGATGSDPFEPLADRALGHTEGLSDVCLVPTLLMQFPSTQATAFAVVAGLLGECSVHTRL